MKSHSTVNLPNINYYSKTQNINIFKDVKQIVLTSSNFNSFLKSNKNLKGIDTTLPYNKYIAEKCQSTRELKKICFDDFFKTSFYTTTLSSIPISPAITPKSNKVFDFNTTQVDSFIALFSEYLGLNNSSLSKVPQIYNIDVERYCIESIGRLKTEYNPLSYLSRDFNKDVNDVRLKFKSIKLSINNHPDGKVKLYLPFDFVILFSFCNYEEIILFLSHYIEIDEETYTISINETNFYNAINKLPMFERKSLKSCFKFTHNITFRWLGRTKNFDLNISCPSVSMYFKSKNMIIKKNLSQAIILHLFSKSFIEWDFNLMNLFTDEKDFRTHFNKIISKDKPYKFSNNRLVFRLDHRFDFKSKGYDLEQITLPFVYIDDDNKANFVLFYGYSMDLKKIVKNTKYLTWKNTIILLQLKDTINLEFSINRRCKLGPENKILFDHCWLNNIKEDLLPYFIKSDQISHTTTKLNFKVNEPRIESQTLINGRFRKRRMFITKDYLNELSGVRCVKDIITFLDKNIKKLQGDLIEEDSKFCI
jgi:hypothetical protein